MDCRQVGQYILALCAQWGAERGAERTGLRTGNGALKATLRGEEMDPEVRAKFEEVKLETGTYLRNRRMSLEIASSLSEWAGRVRGAERTAERTAERSTERHRTRTRTTTKERITELQASPAVWNTEAAEDFKAQYGGNPPAQFFAQVKPVVTKHGWDTVRPVLKAIIEETPLEYLNLPKVLGVRVEAAKAGVPQRQQRKSGANVIDSPIERNQRALEAILRERGQR